MTRAPRRWPPPARPGAGLPRREGEGVGDPEPGPGVVPEPPSHHVGHAPVVGLVVERPQVRAVRGAARHELERAVDRPAQLGGGPRVRSGPCARSVIPDPATTRPRGRGRACRAAARSAPVTGATGSTNSWCTSDAAGIDAVALGGLSATAWDAAKNRVGRSSSRSPLGGVELVAGATSSSCTWATTVAVAGTWASTRSGGRRGVQVHERDRPQPCRCASVPEAAQRAEGRPRPTWARPCWAMQGEAPAGVEHPDLAPAPVVPRAGRLRSARWRRPGRRGWRATAAGGREHRGPGAVGAMAEEGTDGRSTATGWGPGRDRPAAPRASGSLGPCASRCPPGAAAVPPRPRPPRRPGAAGPPATDGCAGRRSRRCTSTSTATCAPAA